MTKEKQTQISKDLDNKKLVIVRSFDAPAGQVWKAWTDSTLLDQWWAPKPWKAETKTMDFREGGVWLYCMAGPDGSKSWCRVDFQTIVPDQSFTAEAAFCDEAGNKDESFPVMYWKNRFIETATGTKVEVEIRFNEIADLEKILALGFESGFTAALENLDKLLAE